MTNMGQTAGNIQTGEMSFWEHLDGPGSILSGNSDSHNC